MQFAETILVNFFSFLQHHLDIAKAYLDDVQELILIYDVRFYL